MEATQMYTDRWTGKQNVEYIYNGILNIIQPLKKEILTHATTQMNLQSIMLNEINQLQKDKYCMIHYVRYLE